MLRDSFTFSSRRNFATAWLTVCVVACGITSPHFEDYEGEDSPSGPASAETECGKEALDIFSQQIQPAIEATCAVGSSCHSSGAGSQVRSLKNGQDDANRTSLFAYTALDPNKLFNKIDVGPHQGGQLSSALPKADIAAWTNKESECASGEK